MSNKYVSKNKFRAKGVKRPKYLIVPYNLAELSELNHQRHLAELKEPAYKEIRETLEGISAEGYRPVVSVSAEGFSSFMVTYGKDADSPLKAVLLNDFAEEREAALKEITATLITENRTWFRANSPDECPPLLTHIFGNKDY